MGTRINEFRESMEQATGEDLRMFLFTRDQLRVLSDALACYRRYGQGRTAATNDQMNRWVEAFDPDWKE